MAFTWKRKFGSGVKKELQKSFENDAADDENDSKELQNNGIDWLCPAPKRKCLVLVLEDSLTKSERLKNEGCVLAELERYWEATKKFQEAIQLTPNNAVLHEMTAQAYIQLNEVFPAVHAAEQAVRLGKTWWVAYQTLGRAQLAIGEVKMALRSFQRAIHLNPCDEQLWKDDLLWTSTLLKTKLSLVKEAQIGEHRNPSELSSEQCFVDSLSIDSNGQKYSNDTKSNVIPLSQAEDSLKLLSSHVLMRS